MRKKYDQNMDDVEETRNERKKIFSLISKILNKNLS